MHALLKFLLKNRKTIETILNIAACILLIIPTQTQEKPQRRLKDGTS